MKEQLAVCAIYFNEAPYLAEWIEFHRLVGVERFYLYDHESTDEHEQVLEPYVAQSLVEVRRWPAESKQQDAYNDWLTTSRDECRWAAFIDIDEFLFSVAHRPLPEELRAFEAHPAVCVGRKEFGTSGHTSKPSGPVIENYVNLVPMGATNSFKCIVDPMRTTRCVHAHVFTHPDAPPVDGEMAPVQPPFSARSFPCSPLCVNHYFSKSVEEWRQRRSRVNAIGQVPVPPKPGAERRWEERERLAAQRDELILPYLPALREALATRPG